MFHFSTVQEGTVPLQEGEMSLNCDLNDKKELALQVIERLKEEYPLAKCTLDYRDAWQLLVSVRLGSLTAK